MGRRGGGGGGESSRGGNAGGNRKGGHDAREKSRRKKGITRMTGEDLQYSDRNSEEVIALFTWDVQKKALDKSTLPSMIENDFVELCSRDRVSFHGILVTYSGDQYVSEEDSAEIERAGIFVETGSDVEKRKQYSGEIRGAASRRLPYLVSMHPDNRGQVNKLCFLEQFIATLIISGYDDEAEFLANETDFSWVQDFLYLNRPLFEAYGECSDSSEIEETMASLAQEWDGGVLSERLAEIDSSLVGTGSFTSPNVEDDADDEEYDETAIALAIARRRGGNASDEDDEW